MMGGVGVGLLVVMALLTGGCRAMVREYFLAAEEVDWDYASTGKNLIDPQQQSTADVFLKAGPDRIGHVYRKALYQRYTDATYSVRVPAPAWQGLVGPLLKAEVGDFLVVHFLNNASREFSLHPHGLHYDKRNEGAFYMDGTSGRDKMDDIVMPGARVRYVWNVTANMAPSSNDPNCIPWVYHSHIATQHDTSTGLLGILVTCKPGTLDAQGNRKDVDKEIALLLKVFDENMSWLMDANLDKCGQPHLCKKLSEEDDEDFKESNLLHAINGYVYGHLPGLDVCESEKVAWYIVGMGNEIDIHNIYFHGQILHFNHKSGDTVPAFATSFRSAQMVPINPGRWMVNCIVADHLEGGMAAYLNVHHCNHSNNVNATSSHQQRRWYYLAVEEGEWNYAPRGVNLFHGGLLNDTGRESAAQYVRGKDRIGASYKKARFFGYKDVVFSVKMAHAQSMGLLGPVIKAEEGDTVMVALRNKASRPYSLRLHAANYGIPESHFMQIGVDPGSAHVFNFRVPEGLLGPQDGDCIVQLYTSAVDVIRDVNSGLVGPFLICKRGVLARNSSDTEKEFHLLFNTFDENKSWYLDDNIRQYTGDPASVNKEDPDFQESNLMSSINGLAYGTLQGLNMCLGDNVTWHVMGLGSETDVNGAYFYGNTFTVMGMHHDRQDLIPGSVASLSMVPDNPGRWAVVSETNLMMNRGVQALYTVQQCGVTLTSHMTGVTRRYVIAAEEVDWDYAPRERELITGIDLNDPRSEANIFFRDDDVFIGDTYKKVVYREYTDSTFTTKKARDSSNVHLDILGPLLKAEVGDVIEVVFLNKASRPYSLHPHGLLYDKASEGATYTGDVYLEDNGGVAPGAMHIYRWHVPERSGPGPEDTACLPWVYTSAVHPERDVNSGLVGALVICRPGTLTAEGRRTDVDREFALLFTVFNENLSWYLDENIKNHAPGRVGTDFGSDADFEESNKMHSINARMFGNNAGLEMFVNDTVVWYFLSVGSDIDIHTVHLHGHTYTESAEHGRRNDVTVMFPGNAKAVRMMADNPGTWVLHCHVLDHIQAGMETAYTVKERPTS